MNFNFITNWDYISSESFLIQWKNWFKNSITTNLFFHPSIVRAWINSYRKTSDVKPLFCVASNSNITVFLPLVFLKARWKYCFQKIVVPVGYIFYDYHDPLIIGQYSNKELDMFFETLVKEIKKVVSFDMLYLNNIHFARMGNGWKESRRQTYLSLREFNDTNDILLSLNLKLRTDIKRRIKKINELGELKLISHSKMEDALSALPEFLDYHKKRWPKKYWLPDFHKNIIESGIPENIVSFTALRIGDKSISWHLGFQGKNYFYHYMPTINPEFMSFSPGKLHIFFLLEYCIKSRISVFDFLNGNEEYKSHWSKTINKTYDYKSISYNPISRISNFFKN